MRLPALTSAVRGALLRRGTCCIAVHSEEQGKLGEGRARRLARQIGGQAKNLIFKVIPEEQQANLPVGLIFSETHP